MDELDFIAMYERHRRVVLRYAASWVGPDAAEDVTASTFVEAWRRARTYDPQRASEAAWLFGIVSNVLARHRRTEALWLRNRALDARDPSVDDHAATGDLAELVDAVAQLPARERDPILLHAVAGLAYEDVATALAIPIGTVRSRISRGTARIRRTLNGAPHGH